MFYGGEDELRRACEEGEEEEEEGKGKELE